MLLRRYRRYDDGGDIQTDRAIQAGTGVAQLSGQIIDNSSPPNQFGVRPDFSAVSGGALKGAATGASLGMAAGPWGAAAGAVAGAVTGGINSYEVNERAKKQEVDYNANMASYNQQKSAVKEANFGQGSDDNQIYKAMGGDIPSPNRLLKPINGSFNRMSNNSFEVEGPSHEEGGVTSPTLGAEVEGGETGKMEGGRTFIYSEVLGFADRHKPIANYIGKVEKRPLNDVRKNTLTLMHKKAEALKLEQEALKEQLGIADDQFVGNHLFGGYTKN